MRTKPKSYPAKPHKHKVVKGDRVRVIRGNFRDQEGTVMRVIPDRDQVVVEGVNVRKHHQRPSGTNPEGGIASYEEPILISNVMLIDPSSGKPTRIRWRIEANNQKERIAAKSGNPIPKPK